MLDYSPLYSLLAFGFKASGEKCDDARTQAAYRTLWKILPPRQRTSAFLGFWKTRLGINFISSALLFAGLAVTGARQEKDLCLISCICEFKAWYQLNIFFVVKWEPLGGTNIPENILPTHLKALAAKNKSKPW